MRDESEVTFLFQGCFVSDLGNTRYVSGSFVRARRTRAFYQVGGEWIGS